MPFRFPRRNTTGCASNRSPKGNWHQRDRSCAGPALRGPAHESILADFNMSKLRIAVAGAGMIGLRHIDEIQKSQSARLSAVVDHSPKAAEVAKKVGIPIYKTPEGVIAKDRPDGIVLATPNQMNADQAQQCIVAGILGARRETTRPHARGRQSPGS